MPSSLLGRAIAHARKGDKAKSDVDYAVALKALRFKTPYEAIEELWKSKPEIFDVKPHHHMLGPNT